MPELPEVETIRNKLQIGQADTPALPGLQVLRAELLWERTLAAPNPFEFQRIQGQTITICGRRAKYLLIHLEADTLVVHLRMSGDLLVEPAEAALDKHARLLLYLSGGWRLAFNDPRKFGRVWLLADPAALLAKLGPEPLSDRFTAQELHARLQRHHRLIKPLLLDQAFIAGLGNIYTDEALHMAGLHPLTFSDALSAGQAERLWQSIRSVLQEGMRRNGASIDWVYRGGDFQNYFQVYRRTGQPCYRCGQEVRRIVVGQRGTHFCPICQPLSGALTSC